MKNNLIALLDQTYPGVNSLFDSPVREDGHQKWVDFIASFWHIDCVRSMSQTAFPSVTASSDKTVKIYGKAQDQISMMPKGALTKLLVKQAVHALNAVSTTLERLKAEMLNLAYQLPEFPVVMATHGVGDSLGPQLMAEIGDVTRFAHRGAITSFAGVDPGASQSGTHAAKSVHTSKSGSHKLRKALFLVMDCLIQTRPQDDPVYRFMDKKRAEGKPYLVYMTAEANKFLRIYYGRVKEYLASLEQLIGPRCWASYSNGFCFRNMIPCSFDYLIYPYYPAYTMGCYQIVISGDNRERNDKRFVCWFIPILPQRGEEVQLHSNYLYYQYSIRYPFFVVALVTCLP